jgi:hypothetical protein
VWKRRGCWLFELVFSGSGFGFSVFYGVKAYGILRACRHLEHAFDSAKDNLEFCIVALFHFFDFSADLVVGGQPLAQLDEGPHDGNVHFDGPLAAQNAGEHGHTLIA